MNVSDKALHEALELILVNHAVSIVINLLEECVYNRSIELLREADLSEGSLG